LILALLLSEPACRQVAVAAPHTRGREGTGGDGRGGRVGRSVGRGAPRGGGPSRQRRRGGAPAGRSSAAPHEAEVQAGSNGAGKGGAKAIARARRPTGRRFKRAARPGGGPAGRSGAAPHGAEVQAGSNGGEGHRLVGRARRPTGRGSGRGGGGRGSGSAAPPLPGGRGRPRGNGHSSPDLGEYAGGWRGGVPCAPRRRRGGVAARILARIGPQRPARPWSGPGVRDWRCPQARRPGARNLEEEGAGRYA